MDKQRLLRDHQAIAASALPKRGLTDDQRDLLALTHDDCPGHAELVGLRWHQVGLSWRAVQATGMMAPAEDWWGKTGQARMVVLARESGPHLAPLLAGLPDVAAHVRRFPDTPAVAGVLRAHLDAHADHFPTDRRAKFPDAELHIRYVIESAIGHASCLLWCGAHPESDGLIPLAQELSRLLARYGPDMVASPWQDARAVGINFDLFCQAVGIDLPNPTGVRAMRIGAASLGWKNPRLTL
jgi:hypothetical protein